MKAETINLIFWQENPNFGDALSPYIISKISDCKIAPKHCAIPWINLFKLIIRYPYKIKDLKNFVLSFQDNLCSTGSIINLGNKKSKIWGSGFMNESDHFPGGKVFAVRGKYSAEKIYKTTKEYCDTFGDPAILLPWLYNPKIKQKHELGIIPHWREVDFFLKNYSQFHIIDTRNNNVEEVINDILSCKKILSSSLHGIIVSHAYNIPALWIKMGYINTDGIKFKDYFSSVKIKEYYGFTNFDDILSSEKAAMDFFQENISLSLPQNDLEIIRRDLIKKAPFSLKPEFK